MLCFSVLLLLACGSLVSSHPDFWTTSTTSCPGTGGRISNLEKSRLTGRKIDEGGKHQPKGNKDGILAPTAVNQDVTIHSLLPTYFCPFNRLSCSSTVRTSRRRNLAKNVVPEYLYARFVRAVIEKAVLQALEGR